MSNEQRLLPSYGRRRGRRLRSGKQGLMETLLPQLTLALPETERLDPATLFPGQNAYWLEIGFGGGEHLAHQAQLHPEIGIIGCEPYINGIAGLLKHIEDHALANIKIYHDDARYLIDRLPDACIRRVFILYPDPWPKARHRKRRLVSQALLTSLSRIMQPGAELRMATDDEDYAAWMLEHTLAHPDFGWTAKTSDDWLTPWKDWISTRYEQKALAAGRVPTYLTYQKIK